MRQHINPRPHMGDATLPHTFLIYRDMIFNIAVFSTFWKISWKFQLSVSFDSWDMGLNDWFTLSCASSVWCITVAVFTVFCKLHLPCVKNVMRRYSRVNFRGQCQLRSIIVLLWPEVKFSTSPSEVKKYMSWKEKHDGAEMNPLSFLIRKLFAKNGTF